MKRVFLASKVTPDRVRAQKLFGAFWNSSTWVSGNATLSLVHCQDSEKDKVSFVRRRYIERQFAGRGRGEKRKKEMERETVDLEHYNAGGINNYWWLVKLISQLISGYTFSHSVCYSTGTFTRKSFDICNINRSVHNNWSSKMLAIVEI